MASTALRPPTPWTSIFNNRPAGAPPAKSPLPQASENGSCATPDHLLGRVNSLGTAQDVTGDSIGALGLGVLGRVFTPLISVLSLGASAALIGLLVAFSVRTLRHYRSEEPLTTQVEHDKLNTDPAVSTSETVGH